MHPSTPRGPSRGRRCAAALTTAVLISAVMTISSRAGAAEAAPCPISSPAEPVCVSGTLADGTPYQFAVPKNWNGTVLVDLDFAQSGLRAPVTAKLLEHGYARGGTTRTITGWNIAQAIDNQAEALTRFKAAFGEPRWAIASGSSMGGFVSGGVAQEHPRLFDAAVALCPGLGGAVGQWNQKLDTVFVLKTLMFPGTDLPVTGIPGDVAGAQQSWISALRTAQGTPEGRARIALAAAIGQLPAWGVAADGTTGPRPGPRDERGMQTGMFLALAGGPLPYIGQAMSSRRQIEQLAGGNPSWNTGVDYRRQLGTAGAASRRVVRELYRQAGLDLSRDLGTLSGAPRVAADTHAVDYLSRGIVFNGDVRFPVLTVNAIGDQISTVAQQRSYEAIVRARGNGALLRQTYVETAGHCTFSTGEHTAAIVTMSDRLRTGRWSDSTSPARMNALAGTLTSDGGPGRYITFRPDRFNRPYYGTGN